MSLVRRGNHKRRRLYDDNQQRTRQQKTQKTKTINDAVATAVAQHRCWVQIETQKEMGKGRFSKNDLDSQDPILKTWSKSPHKREGT